MKFVYVRVCACASERERKSLRVPCLKGTSAADTLSSVAWSPLDSLNCLPLWIMENGQQKDDRKCQRDVKQNN